MSSTILIPSKVYHGLFSKGVSTFKTEDVIEALKNHYPEGKDLDVKLEWINKNSHDGFISLQGIDESYEDFKVAIDNSPYYKMLKDKIESFEQAEAANKILLEQQDTQSE